MENDLLVVNNNQLELTQDGIKFIKKLQKAQVEVNKMNEELKEILKQKMEENDIKKFVSNDGTFTATYVAKTTSNRFDTTNFKKDHEDLYNKYLITSIKKAYVTIK